MRRFETHFSKDPHEAVVAERSVAIARDLERIAGALEELVDDG